MYCNQCGNILSESAAFCTFCGAKNDEYKAPAESAAPAMEQTVTAPVSAPVEENPVSAAEQPMAASVQPPVYAAPTMAPPQPPVPAKGEKLYTFNHILLCLAAVAVMAVVAGVFAGLYFSVI